jgi:hypothetical protein
MTDKNRINKPKRLSKGQRIYVRRLKQAAGKEPIVVRPVIKKDLNKSVISDKEFDQRGNE